MDDDFSPGLLLSHGRDVLVKLLDLRLDGRNVWCELLLCESVQGRES